MRDLVVINIACIIIAHSNPTLWWVWPGCHNYIIQQLRRTPCIFIMKYEGTYNPVQYIITWYIHKHLLKKHQAAVLLCNTDMMVDGCIITSAYIGKLSSTWNIRLLRCLYDARFHTHRTHSNSQRTVIACDCIKRETYYLQLKALFWGPCIRLLFLQHQKQ